MTHLSATVEGLRASLQVAERKGRGDEVKCYRDAIALLQELAFLKPLFTDFEKLASALADEQVKDAPPALVRWAQRMVVMTPERMQRYGHTMTVTAIGW